MKKTLRLTLTLEEAETLLDSLKPNGGDEAAVLQSVFDALEAFVGAHQ